MASSRVAPLIAGSGWSEDQDNNNALNKLRKSVQDFQSVSGSSPFMV
jgi:hypothetical protein